MSHPKNDRDVTERPKWYTLQDVSFMRQSWGSFFVRVRKHTCYARDNKHLPMEYTLTSQSFLKRDKVYLCAWNHHDRFGRVEGTGQLKCINHLARSH